MTDLEQKSRSGLTNFRPEAIILTKSLFAWIPSVNWRHIQLDECKLSYRRSSIEG
jgi:hypothetical protein